jgi:hypothetical protein
LRLSRLLSVTILLSASALVAHADTLDFTVIGQGNTYTFSLNSNPVPKIHLKGLNFSTSAVLVTVNDLFTESEAINFFNTSEDGGLNIGGVVDTSGPQLYIGSESSPTLDTGSFSLLSFGTNIPYTLTVVPAASPVPEPSSFALFGTGILGLAGMAKRRFVHV